MNDNTISDSSHRHGQQKEFVVSSSLSVVQMFSAVQGEENRRKLFEQAARQGGVAASLLSSERGTIRLCGQSSHKMLCPTKKPLNHSGAFFDRIGYDLMAVDFQGDTTAPICSTVES